MKAPVLFIHGKDDDIVPVTHSRDLIGTDLLTIASCSSKSKLVMFSGMNHKSFNIENCIAAPIKQFINDLTQGFYGTPDVKVDPQIFFPRYLFIPPERILNFLVKSRVVHKQPTK